MIEQVRVGSLAGDDLDEFYRRVRVLQGNFKSQPKFRTYSSQYNGIVVDGINSERFAFFRSVVKINLRDGKECSLIDRNREVETFLVEKFTKGSVSGPISKLQYENLILGDLRQNLIYGDFTYQFDVR